MVQVAARELRNDTRAVLQRVESGEDVVITVNGRPVAVLRPVPGRVRWMARADFVRRFAAHQADAALASELAELNPDTTDDLPLR